MEDSKKILNWLGRKPSPARATPKPRSLLQRFGNFLASVLFVESYRLITDDDGRERARDHVYRVLEVPEWERLRKFVDDTLGESSNGTLARKLEDHEIEFLGRVRECVAGDSFEIKEEWWEALKVITMRVSHGPKLETKPDQKPFPSESDGVWREKTEREVAEENF